MKFASGHYVTPGQGGYIYTTLVSVGSRLGRAAIMGDQNADPFDGDSVDNAIRYSITRSLTPALHLQCGRTGASDPAGWR